jgi:hypothetical protein
MNPYYFMTEPNFPPTKINRPDEGGGETSSCASRKYLVIRCSKEGETLTKVSPFLIHKVLSGAVPGDLESVKKLRDGSLLVKTSSDKQSEKLLALKRLHDIPVVVEPHRGLNTCRGVISCYDLLYVDVVDITKEMASQGVIDCRRLTTKRNGEVINTTSAILTFSRDMLPEKVNVGYERCPVRPYIPNPLRCYKCQRFGHVAPKCKGNDICPKCSKAKHEGEVCASPAICANCEGQHPAYSRDCPKLQEEKKIVEIKTTKKITYFEARQKYRTLIAPTFSKSYAEKAATPKKKVSSSTQTGPSFQPQPLNKEKETKITERKVLKENISDAPPMEVEIVSGGDSPKKSQPPKPKSGSPVKSRAEKKIFIQGFNLNFTFLCLFMYSGIAMVFINIERSWRF